MMISGSVMGIWYNDYIDRLQMWQYDEKSL